MSDSTYLQAAMIMAGVPTIPALIGLVINARTLKLANKTHDLVNSQSALLLKTTGDAERERGFAEGAADERAKGSE